MAEESSKAGLLEEEDAVELILGYSMKVHKCFLFFICNYPD